MYLAKTRGTKYTTVTFASTGGACAARLMCTLQPSPCSILTLSLR